jgi:amidase
VAVWGEEDATALAGRVAAGDVSALELVDAAIAAVESVNPSLNAVVHRRYERAREEARGTLPDGPFRGVPIGVKDLDGAFAGEPYTMSCRLLAGYVPSVDSPVMARLRATGAIVVCKTNTPELGILGVTEPELRGPTRNPWNPEHSPGGSSGGSAALVAARALPLAHAGDGGGSIRIPASHCGLFGLKPTRGRVPVDGGEGWSGYVQQLAVCRSVRDAARLLDALAGPLPGDPYFAPPPMGRFADEPGRPPGTLRIAFSTESLFGTTTDPAHAAAVRQAAAWLADLGHVGEEARPAFDRPGLVRAYLTVVAAGVAAGIAEAGRLAQVRPHPGGFEPPTWLLGQIGRVLTAFDLHTAREAACAAGRQLATFHQTWDLFLTATTAHPPPRIGELGLKPVERAGLAVLRAVPVRAALLKVLDDLAEKSLEKTPNTQLFNQTGQPAVSIPVGWEPLPVGVQLAARFGDEAMLLRVAAQLEAAHPWRDRRPPVCAA